MRDDSEFEHTPEGAPFPPATGVDADYAGDLEALAKYVSGIPGVSRVTSAERDALTIVWPGRVVVNLTTGTPQMNPTGEIGAQYWKDLALLDSPALIGAPTAPTPASGNSSNRIATTAFVADAAAPALALIGSEPMLGAYTGQNLRFMFYNTVVTFDGSGNGTMDLPQPFPHGILAVTCSNADFAAANAYPSCTGVASSTRLAFHASRLDTGAPFNSGARLTGIIVGF